MIDTNKVFLTGRLGKDPKSGISKNGKAWANASLATSKHIKDDTFATIWNQVVAFGKAADALSACVKGDVVYVEGELNNNTYEKEGKKTTVIQVVAKSIMRGIKNGTGKSQIEEDFGSESDGGFGDEEAF